MATGGRFVVVGGSGFLGSVLVRRLLDDGHEVSVVDRKPPAVGTSPGRLRWLPCDVLTEVVSLPAGRVVVLTGTGDPCPRWPWTLASENAFTTARLLGALLDRDVTVLSSVEVYGAAAGPLVETTAATLPWCLERLDAWCDEVLLAAPHPCPPWRTAAAGWQLVDADPSGRWIYAMSKLAQERLLQRSLPSRRLTVLRLGNAFGAGQDGVVLEMTRDALAGRRILTTDATLNVLSAQDAVDAVLADLPPGTYNVGGTAVVLPDLAARIASLAGSSSGVEVAAAPAGDSSAVVDSSSYVRAGGWFRRLDEALAAVVAEVRCDTGPLFDPPLPVVVPPRPARPDEVAERQQAGLWSGQLKAGLRWSRELAEGLSDLLQLGPERRLLLTDSGTTALRLAVVAVVGPARAGDVAVLPSFTYPATAEVLVQLGYRLRFADVDPWRWTLDHNAVDNALRRGGARVIVAVDAFGNPADYRALRAVCDRAGVALVADSAAGLGSLHEGLPLGHQADAHAFSLSFAKVLSAGGAGGAVVVPAGARLDGAAGWERSGLMSELHAAAGLDQLAVFGDLVRRRSEIARLYADAAARLPGVTPQQVQPGCTHSWVHWVARVTDPRRDVVATRLLRLGVGTGEWFPALHRRLSPDEGLPVSEELDGATLALPMSSELTLSAGRRVVSALERALAGPVDQPPRSTPASVP